MSTVLTVKRASNIDNARTTIDLFGTMLLLVLEHRADTPERIPLRADFWNSCAWETSGG
jgi:hypothetical protein